MRLGAWGYIVKPFKSESLYDLIGKVIEKGALLKQGGRRNS